MIKQVIVVRKDLGMRKGKMISQGGHAALGFITQQLICSQWTDCIGKGEALHIGLTQEELDWFKSGQTKITVSVNSEEELNTLIKKAEEMKVPVYLVIDEGRTEFKGEKTLTCAAFGPYDADKINEITGHLPLL